MNDLDEELSVRRIGRTVGGRWLLESVLGVGGMATVYAARNATGAIAAIKILHPEMSVRREIRERFLREGYVANHIGHVGVVRALEHGETGDEVFLAMELLAGETLRARVKRHGRLPVAEVLDYTDQILDVLSLAHEKGVVHRDLKPDNLFVGADGRIKILDFGLARVLEGVPSEHRTRTGVALGTLAYMAPEQALGRRAEIDGRVDIFALGATMFRVLAGRRVHEAESEAELLMAMASRPAPPLASVIPHMSPAVAGVVDLALAFSRDARYPDARTMQNDVRALRRGEIAPYASARLSSREEATRAEPPPAMSQRTQPLEAVPGSHVSGTSSTLPMPAYSMGVVTAAPGFGAAVSAPPQAPASVRTAPLSARAVPPVTVPGPGSFATTMPSTAPHVAVQAFASPQPVAPLPAKARGSLVVMLLVGFALLAIAGGAGAWYFVAGPGASSAAPSSSAVAPPASNGAAVVGAPPAAPAPAAAETGTEATNGPAPRAPGKKTDSTPASSASASPGATASIAPTPPPTPSASAATPASPSASAAPPPPPPPAPPPPSPSATAPAPPAPAPTSTSDTPRFGPKKKGRGKGGG